MLSQHLKTVAFIGKPIVNCFVGIIRLRLGVYNAPVAVDRSVLVCCFENACVVCVLSSLVRAVRRHTGDGANRTLQHVLRSESVYPRQRSYCLPEVSQCKMHISDKRFFFLIDCFMSVGLSETLQQREPTVRQSDRLCGCHTEDA